MRLTGAVVDEHIPRGGVGPPPAERELAARHLTYADLEENDEDLAKLKGWLAKVRARDLLGAAGATKAADAVARCEAALDAFSAAVYEAEEST